MSAIEQGDPVQRVIHIRIDEAEERVRAAVPEARLIYLEPDLDRSSVPG